ncbi:hypothetical protein [Usitatibacter palustris]|uniref:Uncharacterized protein n=1 Tax=Usitatibacter palustris TaxID=2732487 RepID=A0A6M4HEJ3_9PROT|nr:hypothetical protein [Usitatibacter palustris]QJR16953.1 hypothetical protein DSM104440_03790 [Usitatibacter palustris]
MAATKGTKKSAQRTVRTEEQKSQFVVGDCISVTIHVRAKCKEGSGKPSVRYAQAKSADQTSTPPMRMMSSGGPTGTGGGGTEPLVEVNIYVDVNN